MKDERRRGAMRLLVAACTLVALFLPGCNAPGSEGAPPAVVQPTDEDGYYRPLPGDAPWAGLASVPLLAWEREPCDPNGAAGPSSNAPPPPAPFAGSVADLLEAIEEAFDVALTEAHVDKDSVYAYVQTGLNQYSHTFDVHRSVGPNLELDASVVWPSLKLAVAWQGVNETLASLGLSSPDRVTYPREQPNHLSAEFKWTEPSAELHAVTLQVYDAGAVDEAPRTRFAFYPATYEGPWPAGAIGNDTLDAAAQELLECRSGEVHAVRDGTYLIVRDGSIGRVRTFLSPSWMGCYGAEAVVVQDVLTGAVLSVHGPASEGPRAGQGCHQSSFSSTETSSSALAISVALKSPGRLP